MGRKQEDLTEVGRDSIVLGPGGHTEGLSFFF